MRMGPEPQEYEYDYGHPRANFKEMQQQCKSLCVCVFLSLYIKCCFDPSDFFPFLCSRWSQTVCPLRQILLCMHRRC